MAKTAIASICRLLRLAEPIKNRWICTFIATVVRFFFKSNFSVKPEVKNKYQTLYTKTPRIIIRAPGRINLIGEHTDYNEGWVLPAAIDRALVLAFGNTDSPSLVDMYALDVAEQQSFRLTDLLMPVAPGWLGYVQAVLAELAERSYPLQGFRCVFGGDIPQGAGLSSSAALCCGLVFGLAELFGWSISRHDIALIAQAAEHRIGLQCGLMDQYAVLFGKAGQAICLDCRSLELRHLPLPDEEYSWLVIDSKLRHELAAGSAYNERRQSCERAVAELQQTNPAVQSLRDSSFELLKATQPRLNAIDYQRACFVLKENERVLQMVAALQAGQLDRAGGLLTASHEGLRTEYEVTVAETDWLVCLANEEPGVLGARQMGGGFGGCTLNLIHIGQLQSIFKRIAKKYLQQTGITVEAIEVQLADGLGYTC